MRNMNINDQPVGFTEAVRLLVAAVIVALSAFSVVEFTAEQNAAIFGLYAALSLVLSNLARKRVTANRALQGLAQLQDETNT